MTPDEASPRKSRQAQPRVLVIEDDEGCQDLIRHVLGRAAHELSFAGNGRDGLKAARLSPPDLILLDLGLPGVNGVEVFKLLKADPATRHVPILVMTAMDDDAGAVDSLVELLQLDDYLRKPFGGEELLARVERILSAAPSGRGEERRQADLVLERGRIRLNVTRSEVHARGRLIRLPPRRYALLRALIAHKEEVSIELLQAEVCPDGGDPATLKKTVERLRKDLALPGEPLVTTRRGYKLVG